MTSATSSSSATPARPPRLTRDATRAWVALGAAMPMSLVLGALVGLLVADDGTDAFFRAEVLVTLAVLTLYFALYAVLTWIAFHRIEGARLEAVLGATRPRRQTAKVALALSGGGATSWSISVALLSLAVVVFVAFQPALRSDPLVLVVGGLLVVASWVVVVVAFAVAYMRGDADERGLAFPGDGLPAFDDYLYVALQISTTYSSSDVEVTTRAMRRRVGRHTLVAFVFNSVIIALLVSALLVGVSG